MKTRKAVIGMFWGLSWALLATTAQAGVSDPEVESAQAGKSRAFNQYFNSLMEKGPGAIQARREAKASLDSANEKMTGLLDHRRKENDAKIYNKVYRNDGTVIELSKFKNSPEALAAEKDTGGGSKEVSGGSTAPGSSSSYGYSGSSGGSNSSGRARPEYSLSGADVPKELEFRGVPTAKPSARPAGKK